ncbi:hypothetical protein K431DRAFT_138126 [Polychaeton citri CBS 116435]|uniref:Uncharacterized protein n=1 Tax=Polychaeton citri CBS 116435 TaxID=1314669 RepID=A0A9P4UMT0_9PEZI|nr:hypothetical protein K431DRAFT_138126 [Polychaeton citri CBS 116435]
MAQMPGPMATGRAKRTAQHSTAQHSTSQHSTAQHSTVYCTVQCSVCMYRCELAQPAWSAYGARPTRANVALTSRVMQRFS